MAVCHAFVMSVGNTRSSVRGARFSRSATVCVSGTPRASPFFVVGKIAHRRDKSTLRHLQRRRLRPCARRWSARTTRRHTGLAGGFAAGREQCLALVIGQEAHAPTRGGGFDTCAPDSSSHRRNSRIGDGVGARQFEQVVAHRRRSSAACVGLVVEAAAGAPSSRSRCARSIPAHVVQAPVAQMLAPVGERGGHRILKPWQHFVEHRGEAYLRGDDRAPRLAAASVARPKLRLESWWGRIGRRSDSRRAARSRCR